MFAEPQDQSGTNMGSASTVQLTLVPSNEVPQRAMFYSAQNRPPLPGTTGCQIWRSIHLEMASLWSMIGL